MSKQVIAMRKDLNMTKGKMVAQGAHASLCNILEMMPDYRPYRDGQIPMVDGRYNVTLSIESGSSLDQWLQGIFTKICVSVNSEEELMEIYDQTVAADLPVKLTIDSGLTMFAGVPTKTCLAIGPANEEEIDRITGHLKLL